MTKLEIINALAKKTKGIDKVQIQEVLESFLEIIKERVAEGDNVYLRGFGSFITKKRISKMAQNITKGETILVPEHHVIIFKPGNEFAESVRYSTKIHTYTDNKKKVEKPKKEKTIKEKKSKTKTPKID